MQHRAVGDAGGYDVRIAEADPADPGRDPLGKRYSAGRPYPAAKHDELWIEYRADRS